MTLIDFNSAWIASTVIITLMTMFGLSFIISFIFWLVYHQNIRKGQ
ncbi:hypothetical protein H5S09_10940 [Limosilactobacillus sp. STM2_1]|uniref:Uncharacterized protein n=1 Tax=Limosilactobacillus rudii TaxID=2759755 RepID=A0A7W3UMS9_9LACO|nr:hypothetical protein [Limosilactobacillus rudii]MBB1080415.1 hypothetical protein [Limosilactobacillus rudii]MBB1098441.1 hypothetical protein [Limosilactobacillus rudii]MCD7135449.1 hypothetical protein [Limosilactobacillus rudii]